MKKIVIALLIFLILTGCSEKPLASIKSDPIEIDMSTEFDPRSVFLEIQDGAEISYEIDEENSTISFFVREGDKQEEYKDIKVILIYPEEILDPLTAPYKATALEDVEIHDDHEIDSNLAGYVRRGDAFEVYEVYQDGNDIWCRIGNKHWINNADAAILELMPYDINICFIKDVVTYTVDMSQKEKYGYWYDVLDMWMEDAKYNGEEVSFEKDGNGNIIHFRYGEYDYDFSFDKKNRIIKERNYGKDYYGNDFEYNVNFEYDSNGNMKSVKSNLPDKYENIVMEYNGNLRIITSTVDVIIDRFDNNSKKIEGFIAPDGDIRNTYGY